jgi:hypothetical protein
MSKIATPMAILISGILIAYVIYSKPVPRYEFRGDSSEVNVRLDKITGETCLVHNYRSQYDIRDFKQYSEFKVCED